MLKPINILLTPKKKSIINPRSTVALARPALLTCHPVCLSIGKFTPLSAAEAEAEAEAVDEVAHTLNNGGGGAEASSP